MLGVLRRDPPPEDAAAGAVHGEPVAVPGGLSGVSGQRAVRAVVRDKRLEVGKERGVTGLPPPHPLVGAWRDARDDGDRLAVEPPSLVVSKRPTATPIAFDEAPRKFG